MAMSELETRILAAELAIIELAPWLEPHVLEDAVAAIRAGLAFEISDDERSARMHAIKLLTDGKRRYAPLDIGRWMRGEG